MMMSKSIVGAIALGCLSQGGFAHQEPALSPKAAAPSDAFLAELDSHLRGGRDLQEGDLDIGATCQRCGTSCKPGLRCTNPNDGICICGLTCSPGTCQLAPTPAPTPAPNPGLNFCFSASTTVQTLDRGTVAMKDLSVGDKVLTNVNPFKYEEVYAFGHWNPTAKATFLQIHTNTPRSNKPLEMTADHILQVNGRFVTASSATVGDSLSYGEQQPTKVTKIRSITRHDGVYAPLTPSGKLLVDNVVVSAYVSLQDKGEEYPVFANGFSVPISQQTGIHMLLSPYRMICASGGIFEKMCHSKDEEGISSYVSGGIRLAKYADTWSLGLQFVLFVAAVAVIVPLFVVETIFGAHYAPVVLAMMVVLIQWWKERREMLSSSLKQKRL